MLKGFSVVAGAMINSARRLSQEHEEMTTPPIQVDAYAGYKGEETPRAFTLDGARLSVDEILDRWYTETHSCFRVRAGDGRRYVLRYHLDDGIWELVMQERSVEK
jgi:hypothetical protein